jgi:hypothetical protein
VGEDDIIWVRDDRGRVGQISSDGERVRYASGEQRAPKSGRYVVIFDARTAEYEFAEQRRKMWVACCDLDSLNRHVLSRMTSRRDLRYEELLADIGVKTLARAALLYDTTRCGGSLRGYAVRCLKRAYARALGAARGDPDEGRGSTRDKNGRHYGERRSPSNDSLDGVQAPCPRLGGLEHEEQLYSIVEAAGLTASELQLLLSRYDSYETLRDLADQLDVASPQTVLNALNRILDRCRRAAVALPVMESA